MDLPQEFYHKLKNQDSGIMGTKQSVITAVILPLILEPNSDSEDMNNWSILFQKRAENLKNQPGEICFPGGIQEPTDKNPRDTAIRETAEELQIPRDTIEIFTELDVMVMPWQLVLHPFVAFINPTSTIDPNSREVDQVFTVSLNRILQCKPQKYHLKLHPEPCEGFPYHRIPEGKDYDFSEGQLPEFFYEFQGHTIWGITARLVNHFSDLIQDQER